MTQAGFTISGTAHPICPVMLGDARLASLMADDMLKLGEESTADVIWNDWNIPVLIWINGPVCNLLSMDANSIKVCHLLCKTNPIEPEY